MTESAEFIDAGVEQVRSAMRDLAGVTVEGGRLENGRTLVVEGRGWSPTLHRMGMRWRFDLVEICGRESMPDHADRLHRRDPSLMAELFQVDRRHGQLMALFDLMAPVFRQTARIERARECGIEMPIDVPAKGADDAEMTPGPVLIDEMTLQLTMAHLQACGNDATPEAARTWMLGRMRLLHGVPHLDDGRQPSHPSARTTAFEERRASCHLRIAHPLHPDGEDVFDGRTLAHFGIVPDTLLNAVVGRPLGEMMRTGTPLDGRLVTHAEVVDDHTRITIEGRDLALATLSTTTPAGEPR